MKVIKMKTKNEGDSDWEMVFKTQNPVQADIVAGNLKNDGIEVVVINKRDSSYTVFGFVELYVPEDQSEIAKKLISEAQYE